MPELPEVETIRQGLAPKAVGRRILKVEVRLAKQVRGTPLKAFIAKTAGKRIIGLRRRAKFLLFDLEGGLTLLAHLGMSGQLSWWDHRRKEDARFNVSPLTGLQRAASQHPVDKHTHLLLILDRDGGDRIQYRDIRQFGHWRLVETARVGELPSIRRLGLEPLGKAFTFTAFEGALKGRRGRLKALLLNQSAVVGLGNIYADEACWHARLHPCQRLERVGLEGRRALYDAVKAVLAQALGHGGTTISDYRRADLSRGLNQDHLAAYGRAGEPCTRCGTALEKTLVSQRTTVFCPKCQRLS